MGNGAREDHEMKYGTGNPETVAERSAAEASEKIEVAK